MSLHNTLAALLGPESYANITQLIEDETPSERLIPLVRDCVNELPGLLVIDDKPISRRMMATTLFGERLAARCI